jgi:hypothetical protein
VTFWRRPGKPVPDAYVRSINGKCRDEQFRLVRRDKRAIGGLIG